MATLPYWNNDEVISSDKLNSMVKAIIDGDPLAIKVSNATKNDVNQIVSYLSSLYNSAKTNLNSATSTSAFDTAYTDMKSLVSNKLGSYASDDTVDLYSTGIRASIITFLQAYDTMMSNDRLNNKNTDNTLNGRIDSEAHTRANSDNAINTKISDMQTNGGGRNLLHGTRNFKQWGTSISKVAVTNSGEKFQAVTGTPKSSQTYFDLITFDNLSLEKDTDYTASFWVKTSENTDIRSFLFDSGSDGNYSDGATISQATTEYTRVIVHFHNGNNNNTGLVFIPVRINKKSTITVWLYGCMLEKGTVAHDWSPAPDDVDIDIKSVNAKADANTASISKITGNGGGRNLGYSTSNAWKDVADTDQYNLATATFFNEAKAGETYTVSADIQSPTKKLAWQVWDGSSAGVRKDWVISNNIPAGSTHVSFTFTWPEGKTQYMVIQLMNEQSESSHAGYSFRGVMLEKGIVAHDWSPNPDEVQSQLDNLNANKLSSADANWNLVAKNSSNTYNYASGSKITLPNGSSITINSDHIDSRIMIPTYFRRDIGNSNLNNFGTLGEYDNAFVPSDLMATFTNRPTNPDTNEDLTGDCFFTGHYAYSGTTVRAFQKIYSCDYNYIFIRSYNSSSQSWTNWSCLTPYA